MYQVTQRARLTGFFRPAYGLRCRCRHGRPEQEEPHTNIPLVGVKASATIADVTCEVTLVQRYRNDEKEPLEVGYTFPLDSRAAVCRFEVEIDGRRVVGSVMPNAEARDFYDDAIAEGNGAYLLEQKKEEIFQMNVGNLPPGKECTIYITYVSELLLEGEMVRFTLPTAIAPRYHGEGATASDIDALKEVTTISSSSSSSSSSKPYGLELDIAIEMPSPVLSVESPSHPIKFQLDGDAPTKGRVTLATREVALDRDFVLLVQQKDANQPGLWVDNERQAVMVSLYPKFTEVEQKREFIFLLDRSGSMSGSSIDNAKSALQLFLRSLPEGCKFNIVSFGSTHEFMFKQSRMYDDQSLRDASTKVAHMNADMGGTEVLKPIQDILADHADPDFSRQVFVLTDGEVSNTDAVLRVIRERTGGKIDQEIVDAVEKGICTFTQATHYVDQFWYHCKTCYRRDPLSGCCIVCKEVCHKGHDLEPRYGSFFCDCGSDRNRSCSARTPSDERAPISLPPVVAFRVFTLGIGAAASRQLVLGMADAGRGTAEFVVPGERIESKVMRLLRLAMQPSVDDFACDWGASWGPVLTQTPETLPPLFDGARLCIFGLVKPDAVLPQDAAESVKVSYTVPGSCPATKNTLEFLPSAALVASTSAVRTLAARHRIQELSDKEADAFRTEKDKFKSEIEALGVKYQLATAHTSFVAKDEREEATEGTMRRRIVPSYNASVVAAVAAAVEAVVEAAVAAKRKRGRSVESVKEEEGDEMMLVERAPMRRAQMDDHDRLAALVMLQRANGSFELDHALAKLIGKPLDELLSKLSSLITSGGEASKQQTVWATALALAFLETALSAIADDWAMMADKSRRWLRRETQASSSSSSSSSSSTPASSLTQVEWLNEAKKFV